MAKIITHPDMEFDRSIPKIFLRNCDWTEDQINEYSKKLSDKNYDIYLYHDGINDIQWAEGIRSQSVKTYDLKHYSSLDPVELLRIIDDERR